MVRLVSFKAYFLFCTLTNARQLLQKLHVTKKYTISSQAGLLATQTLVTLHSYSSTCLSTFTKKSSDPHEAASYLQSHPKSICAFHFSTPIFEKFLKSLFPGRSQQPWQTGKPTACLSLLLTGIHKQVFPPFTPLPCTRPRRWVAWNAKGGGSSITAQGRH